jgi:hypothetical protein
MRDMLMCLSRARQGEREKESCDNERSNQRKADGWIQMLRHSRLHLGGVACRCGAANDRVPGAAYSF